MQPWHMIGSAPRAFRSAASALAEALVVLRLNIWLWSMIQRRSNYGHGKLQNQQLKATVATNINSSCFRCLPLNLQKCGSLGSLWRWRWSRIPKIQLQRLGLDQLLEELEERSRLGVCDRHYGDTKMFQRQISILYRINIKYDQSSNQYQNMAVDKILIKLKELDGTCISEYGEK